ncbi:hypothetical protein WN51_00215 [Melipona quadrifasciata]|uniref:Uncharacterized protein n=1 Tax=Melipona quadrifasciata TaxID=166423 RepID=A0A0M9ABS6_9HYME|nr:hypothetical protein WN51_00215 [Melipona quadrifasciata]
MITILSKLGRLESNFSLKPEKTSGASSQKYIQLQKYSSLEIINLQQNSTRVRTNPLQIRSTLDPVETFLEKSKRP